MVVFEKSASRLWTPAGVNVAEALPRCTHLAIGAHQDDLEFMAFHGIKASQEDKTRSFVGVTCTDGGGSSRTGPFASYTDDQMKAVRVEEQETAARIGGYAAMVQLAYPSAEVKGSGKAGLTRDLFKILQACRPEVVYAHNPADKHDTHLGVLAATLAALRELPRADRPKRVLGCEGWRGLDWALDQDKVLLDVSGQQQLAVTLNEVFASQIAGGKRYDLAVMGRRRANATFLDSHSGDQAEEISLALDLTPLIEDDQLDVVEFTLRFVDRFRDDVVTKLSRQFKA